jgi:carbon dioxide concentrating mechanism protein CcmM
MTVRTAAVSPASAASSGRPQVSPSAKIHSLAQIEGDVRILGEAIVAPGVSIRADQGATFHIGSGTVVQEGCAIYGLPQGKVLGDDQAPYTVWVGDQARLTHKVLIQGPAYIGAGCFVGFRSTLFNARLGKGCIVLMHALVQDVEIPAGKLVPSGSVITRQEQADMLPDVGPADIALARELLGGESLAMAEPGRATSGSQATWGDSVNTSNDYVGLGTMERQKLSPDIVQRARQYLAQGLRIGTEHADSRRYRSGVWQTCSPISASRESEALGALEACLAEHSGEYVRMFGIDPKAKQRVAPVTIQRPDGKPVEVGGGVSVASSSSGGYSSGSYKPSPTAAAAHGVLPGDIVQQVRNYLNQGYKIGTEHADVRRYRSNVWQTCSPIDSTRESDVMASLKACLEEHSGEYVRMFGITPDKKRVAPITIQRPDGKPIETSHAGSASSNGAAPTSYASNGHKPSVSGDLTQQVRYYLSQGYKIGAEHADSRRYRSNVWQTCPPISATNESQVMTSIQACMAEHPNEYVRIFGIDPVAKRRVSPTTVQRPGGHSSPASASASGPSVPVYTQPASTSNSSSNGAGGGQGLTQDVVQQVNQLVNQGYRVSVEHADQRRYRSGAWQTGQAIEGNRVSDILSALEAQLREHQGEYVRLIGIDPRVKRRVLETTIQRP